MSDQPVDPKAVIREELDLTDAEWIRGEPEGEQLDEVIEIAFVLHTDGMTYTAMRRADSPGGTVLVYDEKEWAAFEAGVRDGDFGTVTRPHGSPQPPRPPLIA